MKIRYGVSTLYALADSFENLVRTIQRSSVGHWEIFDDGQHSINTTRANNLRKLARSRKITLSIHAPMAETNIATLSRELAAPILERLKNSLDHASIAGADSWILHPGIHTGLSWVYPGLDWTLNRNRISLLRDYASRIDVEVLIENMSTNEAVLLHARDFRRLYAERGDLPRMVLDIGHSHIHGETQEYLRRFRDKIVHIHAHDNNGRQDQHLAVGSGNVDWEGFAALWREKHFSGTIIVESARAPFASLSRIRRLLGPTQE